MGWNSQFEEAQSPAFVCFMLQSGKVTPAVSARRCLVGALQRVEYPGFPENSPMFRNSIEERTPSEAESS
jgi:hypothetical protein